MASSTVHIDWTNGVDPMNATTMQGGNSVRSKLRNMGNALKLLAGGTRKATVKHGTAAASGTLTCGGTVTGAVGGTINGVTITVTADETPTTGPAITAGLLNTAINASSNALVLGHVTSTVSGAVVTVTARKKGVGGNAITLAASGTGMTASVARLAGGTETSTSF